MSWRDWYLLHTLEYSGYSVLKLTPTLAQGRMWGHVTSKKDTIHIWGYIERSLLLLLLTKAEPNAQ